MRTQFIIVLTMLLSLSEVGAQLQKESFNEGWSFNKVTERVHKPEPVTLPHHWNDDAYETKHYFRGEGIYEKRFYVRAENTTSQYYLYFEGVNSIATVKVNNKILREHKGGYTGFYVNITSALKFDDYNSIEVLVDNTNNNIAPLSGDFTIFGGIYRPVWMINKTDVHFKLDSLGGNGLLFYQDELTHKKATGKLEIKISNLSDADQRLQLNISCENPNGKREFSFSKNLKSVSGENALTIPLPSIKDPLLWTPENPNLYTINVSLNGSKGNKLDEISENIGWRNIEINENNQFLLNGEPIKLMGASRHQDRVGYGIALSDQHHIEDIKALKNTGANFIRLAHYPQSKAVLEACDQLGLLVWEEIPVVDIINNNEEFAINAEFQLQEMIRQHFNHPSVVMWGYMNEAIIQVQYRFKDKNEKKELYASTVSLAERLEKLVKEIDPSRFTVMAYHGTNLYNEIGLAGISDISGWNLYDGWYGGDLSGFKSFISEQHNKYPKRPLIVSEFGAGSDKRLHSMKPRKFDFSMEYQQTFMEHYWPVIKDSAFVMGGAMWNLIDFSSALRQESMPRINNKGLMYGNREAKDVYFYQKAFLNNEEPVLHIATRDWSRRLLLQTDSMQSIKVYSNLNQVEMFINDESLGIKNPENCTVTWDIVFKPGKNKISVKGVDSDGLVYEDISYVEIEIADINDLLSSGSGININVGSECYFHSNASAEVFLPDVAYQKGAWGYINGTAFERGDRPGTTAEIIGTEDDPLFQTQRQGNFTYKFDVKPGEYEVTLCFADLSFSGEAVVYDLGHKKKDDISHGNMMIHINGIVLEKKLIPAEIVGGCNSLSKTYVVNIKDDSMKINFESKEGYAFINGIKILAK
ncbi:glycoside hydrolase family 2 TIM barrel-domain containing protein [Carboxylicivirga linearis]|uniref:DUF4982 domain-containing protein n=1 Tax=Carboxylicivirga linearis TaxID=1628157 RepID=A0ABS5JXY3_9BACT|nr:glycoside hydrolase family 2 TIM barrel-domain containing protein [Carboxylicivirga linearis]MBS2099735.1 DUF4982 domain-containing protein [Carboxylicivirga linearis]